MNKKSILSVILAAAIVLSLAACSAKPKDKEQTSSPAATVVVTDKNGETVTQKDGTPVTELAGEAASAVDLSEKESEAASKKAEKKKSDKKDGDKEDKTTEATTSKPKNPNSVTEIKVTETTENSITLSWKAVACDYYELEYKHKEDSEWESIDDKWKKAGIQLTGLESLTEYSFRVRAIIMHKKIPSESAWTYAEAKTKAQKITRKINFTVQLPARGNIGDTLVIRVIEDGKTEEKLTEKVTLDGGTVSLSTKEKYEGTVKYKAVLKDVEAEASGETDKEECEIDLSNIGINIIIDEDN